MLIRYKAYNGNMGCDFKFTYPDEYDIRASYHLYQSSYKFNANVDVRWVKTVCIR